MTQKLYAAVRNGEIDYRTVRTYQIDSKRALVERHSWTNCFDMEFRADFKDLEKDGWSIEEVKLVIA